MWLTLLLQVIVPLLAKFIENWLATRSTKASLATGKDDFLAIVNKKFWLGKRRLEVASALFDKAHAQHEEWKTTPIIMDSVKGNYAQYAKDLVDLAAKKVDLK